jgi:hypothetical protein
MSLLLLLLGLSPRQVEEKDALWKKVQDIYVMVAQVEARLEAAGPYEPLDPAVITAHYKRLLGQRKDIPQENCPAAHHVDTNAAWRANVVSKAGGCGAIVMGM